VEHQLRNVQQVHPAGELFVAVLADGSVVTWGRPDLGRDSAQLQHEINHL
jgi:hypothetical protein